MGSTLVGAAKASIAGTWPEGRAGARTILDLASQVIYMRNKRSAPTQSAWVPAEEVLCGRQSHNTKAVGTEKGILQASASGRGSQVEVRIGK